MAKRIDLSQEMLRQFKQVKSEGYLTDIGEMLVTSIQENFEKHGRWNGDEDNPTGGSKRWEPVSAQYSKYKTKKKKDPRNLLLFTGRLRSSINYRIRGRRLYVGSNVRYAAAHQYGTTFLPARPFIVIQASDRREMAEILREHLAKQLRR
jgi:phage gpG-like protein